MSDSGRDAILSGHHIMSNHSKSDSPSFDSVVRLEDETGAGASEQASAKERLGVVDIARMANVSTITVSRALRNPDVVSEKTRQKILEIVADTGYVSDPHARALRTGHSSVVVAFMSSMISPQYAIAMQRCSDLLGQYGYHLLMSLTSYSYHKEISGISMLRAIKPAAVLFTGVIELQSNRRALKALGVPIMESWAYPSDPIDMLVGFSNHDCGRLAAEHLQRQGCRSLRFIGRQSGRGVLRQGGFEEAARELGLEVKPPILVKNIQSLLDGQRLIEAVAPALKDGEGVFCANDILALGLYSEIKARMEATLARRFIAFGDLEYMKRMEPGMRVVGIDSALLGERCGTMLLSRLQGKNTTATDYVSPYIMD